MRSRLTRGACLALAFVLCTMLAVAHSGRTDGDGGHYNRSTGEYHYHHGYPAHQHTGGICPYGFADNTGQSSNGSVDKSSRHTAASSAKFDSSEEESLLHGSVDKSSRHTAASSAEFDFSEAESLLLCTVLFVLLGIPLIRLFTVLCSAVKERFIDEPRRRKAAAAEKAKIDAERAERQRLERADFLLAYQGRRLIDAAPPPNAGDHIGPDGLPCGAGNGRWGTDYTVYVAYRGKVYHRRSVCGTACGTPTNITQTYGLRPCSRCYKSAPPDLTWYYEQRHLLQKSRQLFGHSIFLGE